MTDTSSEYRQAIQSIKDAKIKLHEAHIAAFECLKRIYPEGSECINVLHFHQSSSTNAYKIRIVKYEGLLIHFESFAFNYGDDDRYMNMQPRASSCFFDRLDLRPINAKIGKQTLSIPTRGKQ